MRLFEIDGTPWYETLPFLVGALCLIMTICTRWYHGRKPVWHASTLAFAFGEGISMTMLPICAVSLVVAKPFAIEMIDKNAKTFTIAMIFAAIALLPEFIDSWGDQGHHG